MSAPGNRCSALLRGGEASAFRHMRPRTSNKVRDFVDEVGIASTALHLRRWTLC
ncbi:unnamed protein product [Ectocarpus sp. 12 AP-2014]